MYKTFPCESLAKKTDISKTCSNVYPVYENGAYTKGITPNQTIAYIFVYGKESISAQKFSVVNNDKSTKSSDHLPLVFDFDI